MVGNEGVREEFHQFWMRIEWGMCAGGRGGAREDIHQCWIRVEFHRTNYSLMVGGRRRWEVELRRWSSNHSKTHDFWLFWCLWTSSHFNTNDFLTFIMFLKLKAFKNLWLCEFPMFLKLFGAMPSLLCSRDGSKRVSETWTSHKVIDVLIVWAPKAP